MVLTILSVTKFGTIVMHQWPAISWDSPGWISNLKVRCSNNPRVTFLSNAGAVAVTTEVSVNSEALQLYQPTSSVMELRIVCWNVNLTALSRTHVVPFKMLVWCVKVLSVMVSNELLLSESPARHFG